MDHLFKECNKIVKKKRNQSKLNIKNAKKIIKDKYILAIQKLIDFLFLQTNFKKKIKNACNLKKTSVVIYNYLKDDEFYVDELKVKFNIDLLLTGYYKNVINKFNKFNLKNGIELLKDKLYPFKIFLITYNDHRKIEVNWNLILKKNIIKNNIIKIYSDIQKKLYSEKIILPSIN